MMNRFYQTGNFAPHFVAAMLFAFLMSFAFPQTASAYGARTSIMRKTECNVVIVSQKKMQILRHTA